jgi:F-type H+-transporting ATPase subunit delta
MQGTSRQSLAAVREAAAGASAVATASVATDLLSVAALLGRESSLRSALTDNGASPERRRSLVDSVFTDKVAPQALAVLRDAVGRRWSRSRDLVEATEVLGAEALLASAEADGRIDAVENELFRFGRALESSSDLQIMLSNPAVDDDVKASVVADLLDGRTEPETATLIGHIIANPNGAPVSDRLDDLIALAAARRQQLLADVRAPVALTPQQQERLVRALTAIYGQPVTLAVTVEPDLLGGAVVRVGDEIIDGSVTSRLAAARRALTQ